jgi:hypothetical protein
MIVSRAPVAITASYMMRPSLKGGGEEGLPLLSVVMPWDATIRTRSLQSNRPARRVKEGQCAEEERAV